MCCRVCGLIPLEWARYNVVDGSDRMQQNCRDSQNRTFLRLRFVLRWYLTCSGETFTKELPLVGDDSEQTAHR